mgnify:CR=1 FL=1
MKKISILIPCYNEKENVGPMSEAIVEMMTQNLSSYDYELVFIDNDSTDGTRDILRTICAANHKIKAIFNAKNFGQFNSPFYGVLQVTGDCVIQMCCDFQDPVDLIPQYVREWENGYKIVFLDTDLDVIKERLKNDTSRPLIKSSDITELYNKRIDTYNAVCDVKITTKYETAEIIADMITKKA